jgi:hypothetical protein
MLEAMPGVMSKKKQMQRIVSFKTTGRRIVILI